MITKTNIPLISKAKNIQDVKSSSKKQVFAKNTQTEFLNELSDNRNFGITGLKLHLNNLFYYATFYNSFNKGKIYDRSYNQSELSIFEMISMFHNKPDLKYFTEEEISYLKHKTYKLELRTNLFLSTIGSQKYPEISTPLVTEPHVFQTAIQSYYNYGFNFLSKKIFNNFNVNPNFEIKEKAALLRKIIMNSTHIGKNLLTVQRELIPTADVKFYEELNLGESITQWITDANIVKYILLNRKKNEDLNISEEQKSQLNDYTNEISLLIEYGLYYDIIKIEDLTSLINTKLWSGNMDKLKTTLTITTYSTIIKILENYVIILLYKITIGTLTAKRATYTVLKNPNIENAIILLDKEKNIVNTEMPTITDVAKNEKIVDTVNPEASVIIENKSDNLIKIESEVIKN